MRNQPRVWLWAALVATPMALTGSGSAHADDAPQAAAHDGQHDFDFLLGSWKIHLKRRLKPLTGSNQWVEFDGTVVCRSIWNGLAEVEEFNVDSPEKKIFIQGLAVRLYNPKNHQWSIYWANRKNGVFDAAPRSVTSPMAAANSMDRTRPRTAGRSTCDSRGRTSTLPHRISSRRTPRTVAGPGRSTGSPSKHAYRKGLSGCTEQARAAG